MPTLRPDRLSRHIGGGLTFAVTIGLFAFGGYLLDRALDSRPAFLLTGFFVGGVGGFLHLVRVVAPELLPWGKKPPTQAEDTPPEEP